MKKDLTCSSQGQTVISLTIPNKILHQIKRLSIKNRHSINTEILKQIENANTLPTPACCPSQGKKTSIYHTLMKMPGAPFKHVAPKIKKNRRKRGA